MEPNEIMALTEQLSSANGMAYALGEGDDLLNFSGRGGVNLATQGTNQFSVTIANAAVATRTARLFCPISQEYPTQYPGLVATGAFNDTGGNAGLTGSSGTSYSIETWLYYVSKNPSRLTHIRLRSTVNGQLDNALIVDEINPYKDITNLLIYPQNEIGQDTFNQNLVIFKVDTQLDYLSDLQLAIAASSTATITFFMGAEINLARSLDKKVARAKSAMRLMGAAQ